MRCGSIFLEKNPPARKRTLQSLEKKIERERLILGDLIVESDGPPQFLPPRTVEIRDIIAGRYVGVRAQIILMAERKYTPQFCKADVQMSGFLPKPPLK